MPYLQANIFGKQKIIWKEVSITIFMAIKIIDGYRRPQVFLLLDVISLFGEMKKNLRS